MCLSERFRHVSFYLWFDCGAAICQVQPFRCRFSLKVDFNKVRSGRKLLNAFSLARNLGCHCWGSGDSISWWTQELWAIMQSPHWLQRVMGWDASVGRRQWQTHKSMGGCQLLIVTVSLNGCCFNILYRFLCNTLTCARRPRARINSAQRLPSSSPFVRSQSCFNDAWRNIQELTFHCWVFFFLEKSIKIIQLWPSYPVNAY